MEDLPIFRWWGQEIDSLFTNHEPLIPTLVILFLILIIQIICSKSIF